MKSKSGEFGRQYLPHKTPLKGQVCRDRRGRKETEKYTHRPILLT